MAQLLVPERYTSPLDVLTNGAGSPWVPWPGGWGADGPGRRSAGAEAGRGPRPDGRPGPRRGGGDRPGRDHAVRHPPRRAVGQGGDQAGAAGPVRPGGPRPGAAGGRLVLDGGGAGLVARRGRRRPGAARIGPGCGPIGRRRRGAGRRAGRGVRDGPGLRRQPPRRRHVGRPGRRRRRRRRRLCDPGSPPVPGRLGRPGPGRLGDRPGPDPVVPAAVRRPESLGPEPREARPVPGLLPPAPT